MPAIFWLFWHILRDRSLPTRTKAEVETCRTSSEAVPTSFNAAKICNRPLLQSSYAETLRMYVAVYIIRKPEYEEAQILDYKIPKDKMIVISSAMAHMDKRNWNLGTMEEHPVEKFWADRFLRYGSNTVRPSLESRDTRPPATIGSPTTPLPTTDSNVDPLEPKFSLNGYSGAWIPFGGGIHQCPGRHWVKLQMLLSFALITASFDIELLPGPDKLKVDMAKYGLGALQPAEKAPFRIRRRKNAS